MMRLIQSTMLQLTPLMAVMYPNPVKVFYLTLHYDSYTYLVFSLHHRDHDHGHDFVFGVYPCVVASYLSYSFLLPFDGTTATTYLLIVFVTSISISI